MNDGLLGSSCSLLFSVNRAVISFSFVQGKKLTGHPAVPQELLMIPLPIPPEAAVESAQPKLFQSSFLPLDSPPPNFLLLIRLLGKL